MSLTDLNLKLLAGLLLGYMFLDRGFAYVGLKPIFVGEIVLAVLLATALLTRINFKALGTPIGYALIAFLLWSVVILIFNSSGRWIDALRDSVIWGYALYAILVSSLLIRTRSIEPALNLYGRWIPWFALWSGPAYVVTHKLTINNMLPHFPGTDVPILSVKAGDIAIHLAGAATFLILGLHREFLYKGRQWSFMTELLCYAGMLMGVIATGSRNRGGLVSFLLAISIVMIFRPNNRLTRVLVPGLVVVTLLMAFNVSIPVGGQREVSINQIYSNVQSLFGRSDKEILTGTVEWRLEWWNAIVAETVYGDRFWQGSGFGQSLASNHGFKDDTGNRSPHNGHLTILAREGVPGLALWLILIMSIYSTLTWNYFSALKANQVRMAKTNLWLMAYLSAMLLNMSFDVYLEGPQGGIWFWCLVGLAMALTYAQRVNLAARSGAGMTARMVPAAGPSADRRQ